MAAAKGAFEVSVSGAIASVKGSAGEGDWRCRVSFVRFGIVAVGQIENDGLTVAFFAVVFGEDGLGDHIFFSGPVAEVAIFTTLAAEWEIFVDVGIRGVYRSGICVS